MTSLPSSTGGSYSHKDLRSLYPAVTDNHLRYLEKWGLLSQAAVPREQREYSFADLLTVRQVAAELERGTPVRVLLRSLAAERQGQLELDFTPYHAASDTPRAKVIALDERKAARQAPGSSPAPGSVPPHLEAQSALAGKYFLEGSRLDDGHAASMAAAAGAYRKALIVDPDLVPALVNLANLHYSQDELIEAQALYERAIGLDPGCFEAHFNLGNILHDLGRFGAALAATAMPSRSIRAIRTRTSTSR